MKSRRIAWAVVVTLAVSIAGGAWLLAQPRPGTGTFGPIAANPAYIVVNTATPVVFTAQITGPQVKKRSVVLVRLDATGQPSDIVGRLRDDGRNGDAVAGDKTYSLRTSLNEPIVGAVNFKIAARFKPGKWAEPEADDDDWDAELVSAPSTGRDQPAETTKREKRLKKLARYSYSGPVSVAVWQVVTTPAESLTFVLPPEWTAQQDVDGVAASSQTLQSLLSQHDAEVPPFDFSVSTLANPANLSMAQFIGQFESGWLETYATKTPIRVGLRDAFLFNDFTATTPHQPILVALVEDSANRRFVLVSLLQVGEFDRQDVFRAILSSLVIQ